jgi:magnesium-transporting ATPase (P-type)
VGDIILLETGCRVPADCILVEDLDLMVDENYYYKEVRPKRKVAANSENVYRKPDPFLLS